MPEKPRQVAAVDGTDRVRYRSRQAPLITELMAQARCWWAV